MATITSCSLLPISATLVLLLLLLSPNSNAVPMSRTLNLMNEGSSVRLGHQEDYSSKIYSGSMKESWESMEGRATVRMNLLEVNDYPGSGANNRHTPRP